MNTQNIENTVDQALIQLQKGQIIILVDSKSRENEGDLVVAAEKITADHINFMATYGRGLICTAAAGEILDRCQIPMMTTRNTSPFQTNFTLSIDAAKGISTGISAMDRACTIRRLVDPQSGPEDFVIPGHMFPLRAHEGGVLAREGHTEASVELVKRAGLQAASVICEIMNEDGGMARMEDLIPFAHYHNLHLVLIKDVINTVKNTNKPK
jgi:3,4-dihydroxy 2-butanone 4-phosphate synthase/GTP cyclohydrolase II